MRQLVPILKRFDIFQVEKLRKIGKNPKSFRKNHVFEANIIAQAENFWNLLTWLERVSLNAPVRCRLSSKNEPNLHLQNFFAKNPKVFPIYIRYFLNDQ